MVCPVTPGDLGRRQFVAFGVVGGGFFTLKHSERLRPIVISVHAMLDRGAHSGKGLGEGELSLFKYYQEKARREYAASGIFFDIHVVEGAYLRTQGYSEIPSKFLAPKMINLFVTNTLGYDIDRDRTGGCSMGPRPPQARFGGDPFFKTFLGLKEARETTLAHEYAHHFALDTRRNPSAAGNFWADLRNDYWLWRQRHGVPILQFRACANSEWARFAVRTAAAEPRA
jgi:hypothetical protein